MVREWCADVVAWVISIIQAIYGCLNLIHCVFIGDGRINDWSIRNVMTNL